MNNMKKSSSLETLMASAFTLCVAMFSNPLYKSAYHAPGFQMGHVPGASSARKKSFTNLRTIQNILRLAGSQVSYHCPLVYFFNAFGT